MAIPTDRPDTRLGTIARNLRTSRANARALLALDLDTRRELLDHLAHVDAHAALARIHLMPDVERP